MDDTSPEVEQYRLPNGLAVLLSRDTRTSVVIVNLSVGVGAAHETIGHSGYSHLFEHLWFQGSAHISKHLTDTLVISIGGQEDATTEFDRTSYWVTAPANELETLLWMRSDQLGFLLPGLDEARLQNQKDLVRNERRQRYENDPDGLVWMSLCKLLFPAPHPYHAAIIGSHDDIMAARLPAVATFFEQHYTPANVALAIVGNFDRTQARAFVQRYFGALPAGMAAERPSTQPPAPPAGEVRLSLRAQGAARRTTVGWLGPRAFSEDEAALSILVELLGGGQSSVLYRELVVGRQLAHRIQCEVEAMEGGGMVYCDLYPRDGVSPAELKAAFEAVILRMIEKGPAEADVMSAKARLDAVRWTKLQRQTERADMLTRYYLATRRFDYIEAEARRFAAVDGAAIRRAFQRWLARQHCVVIDVSKTDQ